MGEAICGRKYWRAALICFTINFFNQYTGVAVIFIYAGSLLKQFAEQAEESSEPGTAAFPITPLIGSIMLGAIGTFGTIVSYFLIRCLSRKTLFMIGQLGCGIPLFAAGYCLLHNYAVASFALICFFVFMYEVSIATVTWLYIPEVTVDKASGFLVVVAQVVNMVVMVSYFVFQAG